MPVLSTGGDSGRRSRGSRSRSPPRRRSPPPPLAATAAAAAVAAAAVAAARAARRAAAAGLAALLVALVWSASATGAVARRSPGRCRRPARLGRRVGAVVAAAARLRRLRRRACRLGGGAAVAVVGRGAARRLGAGDGRGRCRRRRRAASAPLLARRRRARVGAARRPRRPGRRASITVSCRVSFTDSLPVDSSVIFMTVSRSGVSARQVARTGAGRADDEMPDAGSFLSVRMILLARPSDGAAWVGW